MPTSTAVKVLIVEDNDDQRGMICQALSNAGIVCVAAAGALEAVQLYFQHLDFDAALLDCAMPEKTGFTVANVIVAWEEETPRTHLATLSAYDDVINLTTLPDKTRIERRFHKPGDMGSLPELFLEWVSRWS